MRFARPLGVALLAMQAAWFVHEQIGASRYFCWSPLHEHVWYRIAATGAEHKLSETQVMRRYGRRGAFYDRDRHEFWELNAAAHIIDSIALREASQPPAERLHVTLTYRINHGETRTWTCPP